LLRMPHTLTSFSIVFISLSFSAPRYCGALLAGVIAGGVPTKQPLAISYQPSAGHGRRIC